MDGQNIDNVTRTPASPSRRQAVALLGGGLLAHLSRLGGSPVAAKKKKKKCDVCKKGCKFKTVQAAVDRTRPGKTIHICPGTFGGGTIIVDKNLTLVGAGAKKTRFDGGGQSRVLFVQAGQTVVIKGVTITGGEVSTMEEGGGILNNGTLTLKNSKVIGNSAGDGGGISNPASGNLTLIKSEVSTNSAIAGGGILNFGSVTLNRSKITGNRANTGGGILNYNQLRLVTVSTIQGNTATGGAVNGGGVYNRGQLTIEAGSSVRGNTPDQCAGDGTGNFACG